MTSEGWLDRNMNPQRVFGGKMMRNWLKLTFVALFIATIIWGITLYLVLKEYNEFKEGWTAIERLWGDDFGRWWERGHNIWVIYVGLCLPLAWALLIAGYLRSQRALDTVG